MGIVARSGWEPSRRSRKRLSRIFGGFMLAPSGKPRKTGLAYWLPTMLTLVIGLAV